jgi:hypothetical protein
MGYMTRGEMLKMQFLKGVAVGLGSVVGASIVVALILWLLSIFDTFPLIGPIVENFEQTVDQSQMK